jgi:glycosyltransferase involved in cell wall biosynthesis
MRGKAPMTSRHARVLMITSYYHPVLGGVETHARDLAAGLRARGHRVIVLTTRTGDTPRPGVERVDRAAVVRVWPAVGRRRSTKWWFLPSILVAAWRLRRHYDVMFCPDLRGVGMAAVVAGRWLGRPVVLQGATPGAYSASHWDESLARWPVRPPRVLVQGLRRAMFAIHRRAAGVVCITREHERDALASGIAAARIHYQPHGVDTTRFRPASLDERRAIRRDLGWLEGELAVIYLGRLSREKGILDLLAAWTPLSSTMARLFVVGPDMTGHDLDDGPAARRFVAAHDLGDRVRFLGPTSEPERCLRASDVLVQPSQYEAFPVTVIEAMACGLPVVATLVGGLRDYAADNVNMLVCPPGDPGALTTALGRALADPALRDRLGREARRIAVDRFSGDANVEAYGRLFDAVVAGVGTK